MLEEHGILFVIKDIHNSWLYCFTNPLELGTRVSLSHRQPNVSFRNIVERYKVNIVINVRNFSKIELDIYEETKMSFCKDLNRILSRILTGMSLNTSGFKSCMGLSLILSTCSLANFTNKRGTRSSRRFLCIVNILSSDKCLNAPEGNRLILLSSKFNSTKFTKPRKLWSNTTLILLKVTLSTLMLGTPQKACMPICAMLDLVMCSSSRCLKFWKMGPRLNEFQLSFGEEISRISTFESIWKVGMGSSMPPCMQLTFFFPFSSRRQVHSTGHIALEGQSHIITRQDDSRCQRTSILEKIVNVKRFEFNNVREVWFK